METDFAINPFTLRGAAVHISSEGQTSVLQDDDMKQRLSALPPGLLLGAFQIACKEDAHPNMWEMHPEGEEILVMLTGSLDVEYADDRCRARSSLGAGRGIVIPRGVWHRLELREPGLLLTLTPLQGTRHANEPEGT